MKNDLVSVITIFLNEERFIKEAIESVLSQSYAHWELILVDDGSTDKSVEISKKYVELFPEKIYYVDHSGHQNRGMSASRNLGIQNSSGKFITFLDADDVWLPEKLEQQFEIINKNPEAGMVYGKTLIWNSWTNHNSTGKDYFIELGVEPDSLYKPPKLFFNLLKNKFQTPTTCSTIIRREIFDKIGLFEISFRGMYEDQVFFSKVLLNSSVFVSSQVWAKYRQHPESCTTKSSYFTDRLPFLYWLSDYIYKQDHINNPKLFKAFEREFWLCKHPSIYYWINRFEKLKKKLF